MSPAGIKCGYRSRLVILFKVPSNCYWVLIVGYVVRRHSGYPIAKIRAQ